MAGRPKNKKAAAPTVEVPIEPPPPAPPQIPQQPAAVPLQVIEGEPGNALRNGQNPIAHAQPTLPDSPEALINNVLCREIAEPSPAASENPDPNLTVLEELAKGLTS